MAVQMPRVTRRRVRRTRRLLVLAIAAASLTTASLVRAPDAALAASDPIIALQPVVSGLDHPVLVTNAGDARLFVVEQTGRTRSRRPPQPSSIASSPATSSCWAGRRPSRPAWPARSRATRRGPSGPVAGGCVPAARRFCPIVPSTMPGWRMRKARTGLVPVLPRSDNRTAVREPGRLPRAVEGRRGAVPPRSRYARMVNA